MPMTIGQLARALQRAIDNGDSYDDDPIYFRWGIGPNLYTIERVVTDEINVELRGHSFK